MTVQDIRNKVADELDKCRAIIEDAPAGYQRTMERGRMYALEELLEWIDAKGGNSI